MFVVAAGCCSACVNLSLLGGRGDPPSRLDLPALSRVMLASRSFSSASAMRVERCPVLSLLPCGEGVCGGDVCDGNNVMMNDENEDKAVMNENDTTATNDGNDNTTTTRILTLKQLPSLRWFSAGEKAFSHVECAELESGCARGL